MSSPTAHAIKGDDIRSPVEVAEVLGADLPPDLPLILDEVAPNVVFGFPGLTFERTSPMKA